MKKILILLLVTTTVLVALLASCSAAGNPNDGPDSLFNLGYQFDSVEEQPFVITDQNTTSYFSLDRNTASYSIMRRQILSGSKPASGSVRLEEYVNYFNYNYDSPTDKALSLGARLFDCQWNSAHKLLSFAVAAKQLDFADRSNNIVLLIDTSGSMYGADRLGLIQQSFVMLLDNLGSNDTVSVVTYAGDSRVALEGAKGNEKMRIANIIEDLAAEGSTNGEGGINKAYQLAEKYKQGHDNNRVILATDGDFNVGASDTDALKALISQHRDSGIYLSVLGVGMTNTNDSTMKTLAENGNGNYAYLDSLTEAKKVLVNEFGGTLETVAKDAKIGIEFNKDVVESFRLLGYDSKLLTEEQFEDDGTDAGEIGAGHTVTAVYEVKLKEGADGNVAKAELKYKLPDSNRNDSVTVNVKTSDYTATPNDDCKFITCVLEYGLLLRNSDHKADASFAAVLARLQTLSDYTAADELKMQFVEVVRKASTLYGEVTK